ncbi:MAG TPA: site-specific tyrosine recombinase XerD [Spirochaetes bacterium]|nr:site-specific tyrosine recombinase XerD [Spirochaetota bacterium]
MSSVTKEDKSVFLARFLDCLYLEKNLSLNTIKSYKQDLKLFLAYIESKTAVNGDYSLDNVDQQMVIDFLAFGLKTGLSHRTISRYISSIRAFYKFLIDENVVQNDPVVNISSPKLAFNLPEYLTLEEVDLLLEVPDENTALGLRNRTVIELMYSCGLRVSEIVELKTGSINFKSVYILVMGKGNKERIVPFGIKAGRLLDKYIKRSRGILLKGRIDDSLFLNFRGGPLSRKGIWKMIKICARETGIKKNIKPHILRHSFGTHLVQNGADLRTVQELLGHSDISTTQIYTHLDKGTLIDIHKNNHPLETEMK